MSKILVVEDEGIIARDIQRTLIALGYEVPKIADSGEAALAAVEQINPDLVLMDIKLKGNVDGIETTARLRSRWDIPVIYLTAHSDDTTLARAKATGPHGYLLKPFNERDLRTAIEVALHKHEVERKLAEREHWFSTTLDSIGDAIIATNSHGGITYMNPVAETLTGWSRSEAQNQPLGEVFRLVDEHGSAVGGQDSLPLRPQFHVLVPATTRLYGRHGKRLEVDDSSAAIVDERGKNLGGVVVFRDITERRRMERRLMLAERLASIGTMAAGTAHEINNPLAAIVGNVGFANERAERVLRRLTELPAAEPLVRELREVAAALADANQDAERVRRIVRDLKKFARAGESDERQVLDLPDVIDVAVKLTDNQLRHNAVVLREYGTTPFVSADEGQLVQVFTNLLINAGDAIGAGRASANEIRVSTSTDGDGRAITEIRDSGCGIAPADLGRIFDPFFSTKALGDGMGLGLSICHGIVTGVGGEISVDSEVGRGTTFRIALPATSRPSEHRPKARPAPEAKPVRNGRVLVIDDDKGVSRMVDRLLRDLYEVTTESDPRLALQRLSHGERFDVILCDLMMPEMTGMDVHAAIQAAHPELVGRVVFLTGGAFSQRASQFLETVSNQTLAKPFTVDGLRALICEYVS